MQQQNNKIRFYQFLLLVVSFVLPIFGPIMYFVFKKKQNNYAKFCLLSSLIGVVIAVLYKNL
jgi:RsiW-degrading membrane proteinase PrsW (M82 family)